MARTVARLVVAVALVAGCASAPKTVAQKSQLERDSEAALQAMRVKDPTLGSLLAQAAGYIVFPDVKQGGFVVGGAGGRGVIYENGVRTGFADLRQASVGAQIGGQRFAQLVIVRDRAQLDRIKAGKFDFGGQASATILKAGAAAATFGPNGVAVVVDVTRGAMLNLSLTGQRIRATG
jgi:lipid-binding SYLF domain-containing protein